MSLLNTRTRWNVQRLILMATGLVAIAATSASADTRIMPTRQALKGVNVVVWGNTTLANGTAYTLDCGNGVMSTGTVADRSYIQRTCNYATAASFTATLTVGAEVATTTIGVVDGTVATFAVRAAKINMAIEDGLRFLYQSQTNRAAAFNTNMTTWTAYTTATNPNAFSALALLAIQNHGHAVNGPATDIFQPVVQRGLNYIFDNLTTVDMTPCNENPAVNPVWNPCIGVASQLNIGLTAQYPNDFTSGYATPIMAAAIAAATSASPTRVVSGGIGSQNGTFVAGRTYAEILQRVVNAVAWGQADSGDGTGGWYYYLQGNASGTLSDGSTMGWSLLGLIDSQAAGATIPGFAKTNFAAVLSKQRNNDGTIDYQVNANPNQTDAMTKVGIGLQGLAFTGVAAGDARVTTTNAYITRNWNSPVDGQQWQCDGGSPTMTNKGCGYSMFNIFKGLKAYGISTLPGIGRPAGPAPIAADDWYADYVDNLLANQTAPSDPLHGEWKRYNDPANGDFSSANPQMGWSCCEYNTTGITALAELILAPVAFVLPDPILFSTVGLSPASATNPVGTSHTVTAFAQSSNNQPVPGATISFSVLSGPNAGASGTCNPVGCVTGQDGKVNFTYHDGGGAGTDTIQAFIGQQGSNQVTKTWQNATLTCDVNNDGKVDATDLGIIRNANGQSAGTGDPRDANGDGNINVLDYRYCQLRLTK